MTQARFNFRSEKKSIARKMSEADAANLECAKIILADPVKYAGCQTEWALMFLKRMEKQGGIDGLPISGAQDEVDAEVQNSQLRLLQE